MKKVFVVVASVALVGALPACVERLSCQKKEMAQEAVPAPTMEHVEAPAEMPAQ